MLLCPVISAARLRAQYEISKKIDRIRDTEALLMDYRRTEAELGPGGQERVEPAARLCTLSPATPEGVQDVRILLFIIYFLFYVFIWRLDRR